MILLAIKILCIYSARNPKGCYLEFESPELFAFLYEPKPR